MRTIGYGRGVALALTAFAAAKAGGAQAQTGNCPVSHDQLVQALKASVKPSGGPTNGGFDTHQWAAVVNRDGIVCAVAFSGEKPGDQWPGSRVVAMGKAFTANAFSVKQMALSTANLFAPAQPAQPLYGVLNAGGPPSPEALAGDAAQFGTPSDPALGKRIGGTVVFGGGLALYNEHGIVGGLGLSGDTSCADHNVAWRVRRTIGLDKTPQKDAIVYDLDHQGKSASGFGHAKCPGHEADVAHEIGAGVGGISLSGLKPNK